MVKSWDGRALTARGLAATAAGLLLVVGCSSPSDDDELVMCRDEPATDRVELCQRPRAQVPALSGLSTHDEVRAAIIDGRLEGMCGADGGEAPIWVLCAVFDDETVVVAVASGPPGAHGVVGEEPGLSFPLAELGDEVVAVRGLQRAAALRLVDRDGEVIGSVSAHPR